MTTATKAGGAVLPVVAWWHTRREFHEYENSAKEDTEGYEVNVFIRYEPPQGGIFAVYTALTPRDSAQATIDELRAEVERLTRERWVAIQRELDVLKAKQIDVDAVMRLAEKYANSEATEVVTGFCDGRSDAAREALRAFLTKDRT